MHAQTAAKPRGLSRSALGFTAETDSLLEGDGFEPSVPQAQLRDDAGQKCGGYQSNVENWAFNWLQVATNAAAPSLSCAS